MSVLIIEGPWLNHSCVRHLPSFASFITWSNRVIKATCQSKDELLKECRRPGWNVVWLNNLPSIELNGRNLGQTMSICHFRRQVKKIATFSVALQFREDVGVVRPIFEFILGTSTGNSAPTSKHRNQIRNEMTSSIVLQQEYEMKIMTEHSWFSLLFCISSS